MPPRIIPILGRLRQDIAATISRETIEQGCREVKYSWRQRSEGSELVSGLLLITSGRSNLKLGLTLSTLSTRPSQLSQLLPASGSFLRRPGHRMLAASRPGW